MCRACDHPAYEGEPTHYDLTAADAEMYAADQRKPAHNAATCQDDGCWVCRTWPTEGAAHA